MIRLRQQHLPRGLSVVVRHRGTGDLEVFVSQALSPERQRAAVRVALRASRQAGWRAWPLPGPVAALPAAAWAALRALRHAVRTHAITATAAAVSCAAVVTGVVVITTLPHHPQVSAGKPPARGRAAVSAQPRVQRSSRPLAKVQPSGQRHASPGVAAVPSGQPSVPTPSPSARSSPPGQSPTPTPSPSSSGGSGGCLILLGIRVCL